MNKEEYTAKRFGSWLRSKNLFIRMISGIVVLFTVLFVALIAEFYMLAKELLKNIWNFLFSSFEIIKERIVECFKFGFAFFVQMKKIWFNVY